MRVRRRFAPVLLAAAITALGGCADAATEPDVLVPAGELEAALSIAARLPTFASLAERALEGGERGRGEANGAESAASRLAAARALALRADSAVDAAEAARLREEAYAAGTAPLAELLDAREVEAARQALETWLRAAEGLVGEADLPAVREALLGGRILLGRSRAASAVGDERAALAALIGAADRLAATTPRSVLRRLLPELEAGLAAWAATATASPAPPELRRVEHLVRSAREAEDSGLYVLGLRRAYYARQLLRASVAERD